MDRTQAVPSPTTPPIFHAVSSAPDSHRYSGSGRLLTGPCASPQYTLIDDGATASFIPFVGCMGNQLQCCPFEPVTATQTTGRVASSQGVLPKPVDAKRAILDHCPSDYYSISGSCCPRAFTPWTVLLGEETPCVSSIAEVTTPADARRNVDGASTTKPTVTVTATLFAMQYAVMDPGSSSSAGAIAGMVVGGAVGIGALLALALLVRTYRKRARLRRQALRNNFPGGGAGISLAPNPRDFLDIHSAALAKEQQCETGTELDELNSRIRYFRELCRNPPALPARTAAAAHRHHRHQHHHTPRHERRQGRLYSSPATCDSSVTLGGGIRTAAAAHHHHHHNHHTPRHERRQGRLYQFFPPMYDSSVTPGGGRPQAAGDHAEVRLARSQHLSRGNPRLVYTSRRLEGSGGASMPPPPPPPPPPPQQQQQPEPLVGSGSRLSTPAKKGAKKKPFPTEEEMDRWNLPREPTPRTGSKRTTTTAASVERDVVVGLVRPGSDWF